MFSLRNKKNYLLIICNTPSYLEHSTEFYPDHGWLVLIELKSSHDVTKLGSNSGHNGLIEMSRLTIKGSLQHIQTVIVQISLGIHTDWSDSWQFVYIDNERSIECLCKLGRLRSDCTYVQSDLFCPCLHTQ